MYDTVFLDYSRGLYICHLILCYNLSAGNRNSETKRFADISGEPGECTLHARICGAGIGIFYVIQSCRCILIRSSRSCYFPSLYADEDGEMDTNVKHHSRPLYLYRERYLKLNEMYIKHQIAGEVVRKRSSEDSVIREYWY